MGKSYLFLEITNVIIVIECCGSDFPCEMSQSTDDWLVSLNLAPHEKIA